MVLPGTQGRRRIYLMRHGDVEYRGEDGKPVNPKLVQLTDAGVGQATAAAEMLQDIELHRAVCSGLPRTRQTAEIALAGRNIAVEEMPAFAEIKSGRLADMPRKRWEAEFVYGMERADAPRARFAGGEPFGDFYARVTTAFRELLFSPGWARMLLVAHDGVNRALLAWASGAGLKGMGAFEQDMGCINVLDADVVDGAVERTLIKAVNLTPSNPAKHGMYLTSLELVHRRLLAPPD